MSAPARALEIRPSPPLSRRRRARRILLAIGLALLLLVGSAVTAGAVIMHRFDQAVIRAPLLMPSARVETPARAPYAPVVGPLNFLLLGSYYRAEDPSMGQRSDTIIVAHVDQALDRVILISIPRDLLVDIPPAPAVDFFGDRTKTPTSSGRTRSEPSRPG
jgi:anionic cell wall polymer biosynthesis LytR-Cps2A-Psr (LCP) family protein